MRFALLVAAIAAVVVVGRLVVLSFLANPFPSISTGPAAYQTFTPEAGTFTADFPAAPVRQLQTATGQSTAGNALTLYVASAGGEQVGVGYTSVAAAPPSGGAQAALDQAVDSSAARAKGSVTERTITTYLGQPAEDGVIRLTNGVARERVFMIGTTLFILEGVEGSGSSAHTGYDRLIDTFHPGADVAGGI